MNPDAIQNMFDLFILSTLAQEPMRACDLEDRIEKKTRGVFQKKIRCSKALERMESAGWLEGKSREARELSGDKVYSVTGAGMEHLEAERKKQHVEVARFVEEGKWPAFRPQKGRPANWN